MYNITVFYPKTKRKYINVSYLYANDDFLTIVYFDLYSIKHIIRVRSDKIVRVCIDSIIVHTP